MVAVTGCIGDGKDGASKDGASEELRTYQNKAKTTEVKVQLAKGFDGAAMYFQEEHVDRGALALGADGAFALAMHRCPGTGDIIDSGVTPPLSVDCSAGPEGRCVPSSGAAAGPGEYSIEQWTDNEVWSGLNFMQEDSHYFHYRFVAKNEGTGYGECQFTIQAFGDLDGDGIFSTYERAGLANDQGVIAGAGMYVENEFE